jgi:hemolysin type calcium-binding protein
VDELQPIGSLGDRRWDGRVRWLGLVAVLAIAVALGDPPTTNAQSPQQRVPWPFYRESKQSTFNPYAPNGRYRGSAISRRRCGIVGTRHRDVLIGTGRADVICGRGGADVILGRGGDDLIDGGSGADRIDGGAGDDRLIGVAGKDSIRGRGGDDVEFGGSGADRTSGGAGLDRIYASTGSDKIDGGSGPDQIVGEPGVDRISGGRGDDTLVAQDSSSDQLDGGAGTDTALADVRSQRAGRRGAAADRLRRIEATDPPPLAVGQTCSLEGTAWLSCQGTGQFGEVTENSNVTFQDNGNDNVFLDYVGLHGFHDENWIGCCGGTFTVGLGAGHWGSDFELWIQAVAQDCCAWGNTPDLQVVVTSIQPAS